VDRDERAAVHGGGEDLLLLEVRRDQDHGADAGPGRGRGGRVGPVAGWPAAGRGRTLKPTSVAAASATATTRSLNEWVGLPLSSLIHSRRIPSSAASPSARTSLVQPGSVVGRLAMSRGTGSSGAYRQMLCGPASMAALV